MLANHNKNGQSNKEIRTYFHTGTGNKRTTLRKSKNIHVVGPKRAKRASRKWQVARVF